MPLRLPSARAVDDEDRQKHERQRGLARWVQDVRVERGAREDQREHGYERGARGEVTSQGGKGEARGRDVAEERREEQGERRRPENDEVERGHAGIDGGLVPAAKKEPRPFAR